MIADAYVFIFQKGRGLATLIKTDVITVVTIVNDGLVHIFVEKVLALAGKGNWVDRPKIFWSRVNFLGKTCKALKLSHLILGRQELSDWLAGWLVRSNSFSAILWFGVV